MHYDSNQVLRLLYIIKKIYIYIYIYNIKEKNVFNLNIHELYSWGTLLKLFLKVYLFQNLKRKILFE